MNHSCYISTVTDRSRQRDASKEKGRSWSRGRKEKEGGREEAGRKEGGREEGGRKEGGREGGREVAAVAVGKGRDGALRKERERSPVLHSRDADGDGREVRAREGGSERASE